MAAAQVALMASVPLGELTLYVGGGAGNSMAFSTDGINRTSDVLNQGIN